MFDLHVNNLRPERMKDELLAGNRVLEPIKQPAPAKILVEILGGDTAEYIQVRICSPIFTKTSPIVAINNHRNVIGTG